MDIIAALISSIINFLLVLFVFRNNRRSATNIYFSALFLFNGIYPIFNYLALHSTSNDEAFIWAKLILFVSIPIGPLFYSFVKVFPDNKFIFNKNVQIFLLFWMIINYIFAYSGLIFSSVTLNATNLQIEPGVVVISFGLSQALTILLGSVALLRKYKHASGILKLQLKYITYGILIGFGLTLFSTIIMPIVFGVTTLIPLSPLYLSFVGVFIAYSIVRHRLLDIRLIIARTISFSLLILYVTFVYALLLIFFLSMFTGLELDNKTFLVSAVLLVMMALTIQPIRRGIEKVTDGIFYKDRYDAGKLLYNLTLKMASTFQLDELLHELLRLLLYEMRISRGVFILLEEHKIHQIAQEGYVEDSAFDEQKISILIEENKIFVFEELPEGQMRDFMRELGFTFVIPLCSKDKTIGLLALGEKLSGDIYDASDIQILETFAPEAAVAIDNARAYDEIRKFNVTLREEVKRATRELQEKNEQLKQLDRLKDDFVSVASHELRTPMTAIKSYLWMALAQKGGPLNEKQKYYLQRSYNSVDRLIKLVNDMLNISRIDSGRLTLEMLEVNVIDLARDIVDEVGPRASELGVAVVLEQKDSNIPHVMADADKIKEVIYNLIGNSLKFTPKGGRVFVAFKKNEDMIEVAVKDNGAGIDPADLPKLFQKFGILPGSYSTNQPAMGSGLGLYICRSIVDMHGGKIWVESEGKGKGTTFTFSLKVFNQEEMNKINAKNNNQKNTKLELIHTHVV